jgi:hypothetical protein
MQTQYAQIDIVGLLLLTGLCTALMLVIIEGLMGTWSTHTRHLQIERNKSPLFSTLAHGQIGATRIKHASIQVRVYDEFLIIMAHRRFLLRYEQIERVDLLNRQNSSFKTLQIHHHGRAPHRLLLTTPMVEEMRDLIDVRIGLIQQSTI